MEEEIWKDVVGYEGVYLVSNFGRVLSRERVCYRESKYKGVLPFKVKERIIKPAISWGYLTVRLAFSGKDKSYSIHRLVAIAFLENPHNYEQVNHKDGNKLNNKLSNLEWCSRKQNIQHAYNTALMVPRVGEHHWKALLSEEDVVKIRDRFDTGELQKPIARDFNCSVSTVAHIGKRRTWKHLL